MEEEQIFSNSKTIKELIKFIKDNLIIKKVEVVERTCYNCGNCYHEFDGDYGEIDCGYTCMVSDYIDDDKFPYNRTKCKFFTLAEHINNSCCIWSTIEECNFLDKSTKIKLYKKMLDKQHKMVVIK